eukprot:SAG31_NODE_1297_length_8934_cov_26.567176_12_plen_67_part_00
MFLDSEKRHIAHLLECVSCPRACTGPTCKNRFATGNMNSCWHKLCALNGALHVYALLLQSWCEAGR